MAQIYGELIRAQLQVSASDLGSPAAGLIYFNSTTGAKWYSGSAWKTAVDLDSSQTLANKSLDATCSINSGILPVVPLTKGGLGADASAWSGFVKISGGVASAASLSASDLPLVTPSKGGTGVANNDAATLTRTGDHALTLTTTATTSLTLPTTGTVAVLDDITASNLTGVLATSKGGTGQNSTATFPTSGTVATTADITSANFSGILASTKGGTGVNNAGTLTYGANNITLTTSGVTGVTLPTSGTLATLAGSETLSSKTLLENTVDNFLAFNEEAAAPATPSAGKVAVYAKSDSKIYKKDSTGAESEIGAGGSGTGRNYLQDWFDGTKPIGTIINGLTSTGNRSTSGGANLQWGASSTSNMTVTLETVTPLRQTSSIKIDSLNTTSGAFVESPMFLIDNADLGKPLSVEFDIGDIAANTNYDIVVMQYTLSGTYVQTIPVAGNASTGSPSSAQLPTGTTKFRGFFITAGDAGGYYYSLRIRKLAAVDDDFQIDSLFVGPQSLAQGAVVTAWQSYTPTLNSSTGVASSTGRYRRIGDSMQLQGFVSYSGTGAATTFTFGLPPGTTINTSNLANITNAGDESAFWYDQSTNSQYALILDKGFSTTAIALRSGGGASLSRVVSSNFGGSNDIVQFECTLPIAEWSSGTTTLADRAVEEFVSHDGTNIVRGPAGSLVPSVGFSTGVTQFIVDFQQALNATDSFVLEFSRSGLGWQNASDIYPWSAGNNASGSNFYGLRIYKFNATQYAIEFGNQGIRVAISNQSAGAESWANERIAGTRFRLRKVSGGAAVGFPVSARNIVGDTSGSVVPTGMLGEKIDFTPRAVTTASNVYRANLSPLATLTSGIYLIFGTASLPGGTGSTSVTVIATNSNNDNTGFVQTNYTTSNYQTAAAGGIEPMMPGYLVVPANSTQSIYAKAFGDVGTPIVTVGGFAVRIA